MLNFDPQLLPYPSLGGHDFHNFESTLPNNASKQGSGFLPDWFWEEGF